jgi:hypothetical protein
MTNSKWVLILGATVTLVGLMLSSFPLVVKAQSGGANAQMPLAALIILAIGAGLLVAAIAVTRRQP